MHFADAFLKTLFGKDGTDDWAAWGSLALVLLLVLVIRAKRHARAHVGWGVLLLPLGAAIVCTIYTAIHARTGLAELVLTGVALVLAVLLFWQIVVRAIPKALIVQIPLLLLALALTVTVGLDALLNYPIRDISFSVGHVANATSYAVAVLVAVSVITLFVAFWVIVGRGIKKLVKKINGTP